MWFVCLFVWETLPLLQQQVFVTSDVIVSCSHIGFECEKVGNKYFKVLKKVKLPKKVLKADLYTQKSKFPQKSAQKRTQKRIFPQKSTQKRIITQKSGSKKLL